MMSLIWVLSYWEIEQLESGLGGKQQMQEELLASLCQARPAPRDTLQSLGPTYQCQIQATRLTSSATHLRRSITTPRRSPEIEPWLTHSAAVFSESI